MRNLLLSIIITVVVGVTSATGEETAYVINTTGETLSKIDLATSTVTNDILTLGSDVYCYPNQIVVRDTMAYVVNSGTNEIQVIDLAAESTVGFIPTGAGTNPYWLAFLDAQYFYVTEMLTNSLAKIDATTGAKIAEVEVGVSPEGVLIHDYKAYVAVTAYDFNTYSWGAGKVAVYDTGGDTAMFDISVGTNPQFLACDTSGRIHVVCTGDYWSAWGMVYVIDPVADVVIDSVAVGGSPGQLTIGPDNIAYLAAGGWVNDGYLYSYDAGSLEVLHGEGNPILVDAGCTMAVAYADGSCFIGGFSDYVRQMDSDGNTIAHFALGDGPAHADFNYRPGDVNGNGMTNISDITYYVDWLFGIPLGPPPPYPKWRANVNGDGYYNISDITYLVAYLYGIPTGPPPRIGPTWLD